MIDMINNVVLPYAMITTKTEVEKTRVERGRLRLRQDKLQAQRADIVEKRLNAISAYEYDVETKKWCNDRLKAIDQDLSEVNNARLLRFRERIVNYNFDVKWTPGKTHCIADALSRAPVFSEPEDSSELATIVVHSLLPDPRLPASP